MFPVGRCRNRHNSLNIRPLFFCRPTGCRISKRSAGSDGCGQRIPYLGDYTFLAKGDHVVGKRRSDSFAEAALSLTDPEVIQMVDKVLAVARYFTNLDTPGRSLKVHADDTFLVSYPRSGNTWTRFLLANFVHPEAGVTLLSADRLIPNVDGQSKKYFKQMPRPRIIKSHYPFHQSYKRVIYVVRDPRDVVLSQYHYQIKRRALPDGAPIEQFVSNFVAGEVCPYGSWGENVASWLAARRTSPNFVLVRYEDLLKHTTDELARMAKFLRIDPVPDRLALAVERSTADRMRQLEKAEGSLWASTKDTRPDISFIRVAKDRQWRTSLPEACIAQIESAWGDLMESLGYTLELAYFPRPAGVQESSVVFSAKGLVPAY